MSSSLAGTIYTIPLTPEKPAKDPRKQAAGRRGGTKSAKDRVGNREWSKRMQAKRKPKRRNPRGRPVSAIMTERPRPVIIELPLDMDGRTAVAEYILEHPAQAQAGVIFVDPDKIEVVREAHERMRDPKVRAKSRTTPGVVPASAWVDRLLDVVNVQAARRNRRGISR